MILNWKKIRKHVQKLQRQIAKAVRLNKWCLVNSLSRLITNSIYAKLLAVLKVVTNKGKRTTGVDNVRWTKDGIIPQAITLKRRGYKPLPLKRKYILKKNGKKRPLGIPTMKDRAMQALYLMALEPIAECFGDLNSYGFRTNRACRDAINQIFRCIAQQNCAEWIYEADIKGCFDNINHKWLLENIPMDKQILRKWLKAGYIENQNRHPTVAGTPQGGIISPTLMNLTMDGLENLIRKQFPKWKHWCKVNFIRYADDFVITAANREIIEKEIAPLVKSFLEKRGLSLSEEKTKITHIKDGFDFLSQNTRKYSNGKVLQKPAKKAIVGIRQKLRELVFKYKGATAKKLIQQINSVLRGWSNYHKHIVSKEIFKEIDFYLWKLLGRWCKLRHATKPWKWIREKYFSASQELCTFSAVQTTAKGDKIKIYKLFRAGKVPIIRHIKIQSAANPFITEDDKYFAKRRKILWSKSIKTKQRCIIVKEFKDIDKTLLNLWKCNKPDSKLNNYRRNARAV